MASEGPKKQALDHQAARRRHWSATWRAPGVDYKRLCENIGAPMNATHFVQRARRGLSRVAGEGRSVVVAIRHKVFISYHHADQVEAEAFAERFKGVFIARMVGVTDADGFETYVDSEKTDYVMRKIREKYLADSTVTIVLIGNCTWARRYVDWEIASTLRNDPINKRSGLMAVSLKPVAATDRRLPARLDDNVDGEEGYARWWKYPTSDGALRSCIEIALAARDRKSPNNSRQLRKRNGTCP